MTHFFLPFSTSKLVYILFGYFFYNVVVEIKLNWQWLVTEKVMIGPMMAINHWPNQVLVNGASKGPMMFLLVFGMANSHWANGKRHVCPKKNGGR